MTTPATSALDYYVSTAMTNANWKKNFDQIVNWLVDGTADLAVLSATVGTKKVIGSNITSTLLSDDYSETGDGTTWATRTGATITITTTRASSKVLLTLRSVWTSNGSGGWLRLRINRDSTTEYRSLGSVNTPNTSATKIHLDGTTLFTGLTLGSHTFTIEVQGENATGIRNLCSGYPDDETFEIIAQEV